jgi:phosphatidate cytidylyltransferase
MASALLTRAVSAVLLAVPVLAIVHIGSPFFGLLILVAAGLMATEWYGMCGSGGSRAAGLIMAASVMVSVAVMGLAMPKAALAVLGAGLVAVFAMCKGRNIWLPAGVLYIGLPSVAFVALRNDPDVGRQTVYWLLAVVWASDIGAYLTGRSIGGAKLAPRISPGKTWTGFYGGVFCAGLAGAAAAATLGLREIWPLAMFSCALGGVAQCGDLLESWIKRRFGVKDSGNLIPGHGGILDRVDALIAVIVVTAMISTVTKGSIFQWL